MGLDLSSETEAWLRAGAEAAAKDQTTEASRHFLALLELGYLAASADGLADAERDALAHALEEATDAVVDHESFARHFRDLDAAVEALGRRERLLAASTAFADEHAREEALRFAALVAMADEHLDAKEMQVLEELGACFGFAKDRVHTLVEQLR